MDKEKLKRELYKALNEKEKQIEKSRLKRTLITIAFYSILFFLIWYFLEKPEGVEILGNLIASVFLGGVVFWINAMVFNTLNTKAQEENKALDQIKAKISELEGRRPLGDDDEW